MNKKQRKKLRQAQHKERLAAARALPGTPVTRKLFRWKGTGLQIALPIRTLKPR